MPSSRIFLVGYRGTGKTTVGRLVADRVGWDFHDADARIEEAAGKTIADIFAAEGEPGFRDRESFVLAELCRCEKVVVSTGGGVILREDNRGWLRSAGFVAWLTASPETIWRRMVEDPTTAGRRPNLTAVGGLPEVVNLLAVREPLYRSVADAVVPTDGRSPDAVAADILSAWEVWPGRRPQPSPPV